MDSKANKLDLEEICQAVFHKHLRNHQTFQNIEWKKHPNGKNFPPDFNLIIEDKTYAVEITGLTRIKKSRDDQIDVGTYQVSRLKLANELTEEALELEILRGTYTINFRMDWLVPLKKVKKQIKKQVFDYLQKSKDKDIEHDSYIRYQLKPIGQISKIANKKSRIYATFTDAEWSDSPEVLVSAHDMVQRAISSKLGKLQNGNVTKPWMLLLYNSNPFASEITFRQCEGQQRIEGKEFFDRIFIVTSLESGFDFYLKGKS